MKRSEVLAAQEKARQILASAGVSLTSQESANIEVADLGLDRLASEGLELVTYVNTDRYCAKELVLFPGQTCPQHRHPTISGRAGQAGNVSLSPWDGMAICGRGAHARDSSQGPGSKQELLHGFSRNCVAARRTVHHPPGYIALVSGRSGWCSGFRVFQHQL